MRDQQLEKVPRDPWGTPLHLLCPAKHDPDAAADVFSAGPDRQPGTDDDIRSWEL